MARTSIVVAMLIAGAGLLTPLAASAQNLTQNSAQDSARERREQRLSRGIGYRRTNAVDAFARRDNAFPTYPAPKPSPVPSPCPPKPTHPCPTPIVDDCGPRIITGGGIVITDGWGVPLGWTDDRPIRGFATDYASTADAFVPGPVVAMNAPPSQPVSGDARARVGDATLSAAASARHLIRERLHDDAVRVLRERMTRDDADMLAARLLGLVLVEAGRVEEGASLVRAAYRLNPKLAASALSFDDAGFSPARAREMIATLSQHAHKEKSASAWLGVGMLMQAEGRRDLARTMIERARKAGLEGGIADAMTSELALP